jgi:hypothetical protein
MSFVIGLYWPRNWTKIESIKGQAVYILINITLKRVRLANFCHGKTIIITYSDCVFVALVVRHAKRLRRAILSSVASPALQYFSILFHEGHDFRKKKIIGHKMCVLILSTTSFWKFSHFKEKLTRCYHKCTLVFMSSTHYSCHILMTIEFSSQIFKKYSYIKYRVSGLEVYKNKCLYFST